VPLAHVIFHPGLHVVFIAAWLVTAVPNFVVSGGEVEVSTCEVTLEVVSHFKTFTGVAGGSAVTDDTTVGTGVSLGAWGDISEWEVSSQAVDVPIGGPEFEKVSLGAITFTVSSEPGLGP
jgi:hypothetical protein